MTISTNPYQTVGEFLQHFNLTHHRKSMWTLTDPKQGHIRGLPQSYGRMMARNDLFCLILTSSGQLYEGHVHWFVEDAESEVKESTMKPKKVTVESKLKQLLA